MASPGQVTLHGRRRQFTRNVKATSKRQLREAASAFLAKKADVTLTFPPRPEGFRVEHGKNRMGGKKEPPRIFTVIDTDDGGLDIQEMEHSPSAKAEEMAEAMVMAIESAEELGTNALRAAVKGGKALQAEAMELLRNEDPLRVIEVDGYVETKGGRQRGKVWRVA